MPEIGYSLACWSLNARPAESALRRAKPTKWRNFTRIVAIPLLVRLITRSCPWCRESCARAKWGYDNDSCKNGPFALFGASQREMPGIELRERSPCSLFHKVGWFSRLWSARIPIRASDARAIPCTRSALRLDHGVLLARASFACQRSRLLWHVGA